MNTTSTCLQNTSRLAPVRAANIGASSGRYSAFEARFLAEYSDRPGEGWSLHSQLRDFASAYGNGFAIAGCSRGNEHATLAAGTCVVSFSGFIEVLHRGARNRRGDFRFVLEDITRRELTWRRSAFRRNLSRRKHR